MVAIFLMLLINIMFPMLLINMGGRLSISERELDAEEAWKSNF